MMSLAGDWKSTRKTKELIPRFSNGLERRGTDEMLGATTPMRCYMSDKETGMKVDKIVKCSRLNSM